jgi:hypothetical protein
VADEDAAQQYLLDPATTLASIGLSRVTAAEIRSASRTLGLPTRVDRSDAVKVDGPQTNRSRVTSEHDEPGEEIRDLLLRNYTDGGAHRNILSCGDLSREFDAPQGSR